MCSQRRFAMSTEQKSETAQSVSLTAQQKQQFHDDGFLHIQNLLPNPALQPLIDELSQMVEDGVSCS